MKKRLFIGLYIALVLVFALQTRDVQATNGGLKLYGIIGLNLVEVDPNTGDASWVANLSGPIVRMGPIAFDSTTGILYGLARAAGSNTPQLVTIDICTGAVSIIGGMTLPGHTVYFGEGFAINPSGIMYASVSIDRDIPQGDYYSETLVTVNPANAQATWVATISNTTQREADGLEFVNGTLYATDDPGRGPTYIYTINTSTGVATLKGQLSNPRFNNVNDMAYNSSTELLYGFDPGAYTNGHPRYLCTISQPGTAAATPKGITHTAAEFGGALMGGLAWASAVCCEPFVTDLWTGAGQNDTSKGTNVGTVSVADDGEYLYVTYQITSANCFLTEVHLYVGSGPPTTAVPGKFPYKDELTDTTTVYEFPPIPLADLEADCDDTLFIAAHAVVCCDNTFLECETAWGFGDDNFIDQEVSKKWGWYFQYTVCCF